MKKIDQLMAEEGVKPAPYSWDQQLTWAEKKIAQLTRVEQKKIDQLMVEDGQKNGPFHPQWQLNWAAEKIAQLTATTKKYNCAGNCPDGGCGKDCCHKSEG
ncbi:MAG TPA: hypothetical protein PLH37_03655 [bacterium]|nr:hypothetical protein [bacterium]